jgi:hypothetical protein
MGEQYYLIWQISSSVCSEYQGIHFHYSGEVLGTAGFSEML